MGAPRIFGLDTVMIDVVLVVDELPRRGSDSLVLERVITTGGGFNTMSAAVRQGADVVYAGRLGEGPFAAMAHAALVHEGIATPIGSSGPTDLGSCIVFVDRGGERTFVTTTGAEGTVTSVELDSLGVRDDDVVVLSGYNLVYPDLLRETLRWFRGLDVGVVVAFDPGPRARDLDEAVVDEVMTRTDWLLCNADEAKALTGHASPSEAAHALASRVRGRVVLRTGADGCLCVGRDGVVISSPGYPAVVVDTNGAGDVHSGVLLAELTRGTHLGEALDRANAAASVAIGLLGPATCPTRDVVTDIVTSRRADT